MTIQKITCLLNLLTFITLTTNFHIQENRWMEIICSIITLICLIVFVKCK